MSGVHDTSPSVTTPSTLVEEIDRKLKTELDLDPGHHITPPVFERVDPAALEKLLAAEVDCVVAFDLADCRVQVSSSHADSGVEVTVTPLEESGAEAGSDDAVLAEKGPDTTL